MMEDRDEMGAMWDPVLRCPACAYPLVQVEKSGLKQCPECGAALNFDELSEAWMEGRPLGGKWSVLWRVISGPDKFFAELWSPKYYVKLSPRRAFDYRNWAVWAGVLASILFAVLLTMASGQRGVLCFAVVIPVLCLLYWAAVDQVAGPWVGWLLKRSGHSAPLQGKQRVMFFASTVYILLEVGLSVFLLFAITAGYAHSEFVAIPILGAAGTACLLWTYWSWILMRAFQAEIRGLDRDLSVWAFFNPGLVLAWGLLVLVGLIALLNVVL